MGFLLSVGVAYRDIYLGPDTRIATAYMSYTLNSFNRGDIGDYVGDYYEGY